MAEEEKDGALAPADGAQTPLSEIVDKPRLSDPPAKAVTDEPRRREERPERKQKPDKPAIPEGYVPLSEVLDTRDKLKAERERADRAEKAWSDHQRKLAADAEKDPPPDKFRDPDGYDAWVERQIDKRAAARAKSQVDPILQQVSEQQLSLSEMRAERSLGPDRWKKLNEWIEKQNDQFKHWAMSQPDPYWAAYQQYRQRSTFEALGDDDLESYVEKRVKERLAQAAGPIDPPDDEFDEDDRDLDRPKPRQAPKSFAGSRSVDPTRDASTGRFTGPRPLGELVKENQNRPRKR